MTDTDASAKRSWNTSRDQAGHFEENLLIFLVCLRLDLLSELDHRLELRVVLLILDIAMSVSVRPCRLGVARSRSASIAATGRLTKAFA